MSKKHHNYTNYSKPQEAPVEEPVVEPVTPEPEEVKPIRGVVTDCERLNVREEPNGEAAVLATIILGTEVMIDETESTEDFYKIYTEAGVEGYCMKRYINTNS